MGAFSGFARVTMDLPFIVGTISELNNVKGLLDTILSHVRGLQHIHKLHYVIAKSGHRDLGNGQNPVIKLPYGNPMASNSILLEAPYSI